MNKQLIKKTVLYSLVLVFGLIYFRGLFLNSIDSFLFTQTVGYEQANKQIMNDTMKLTICDCSIKNLLFFKTTILIQGNQRMH